MALPSWSDLHAKLKPELKGAGMPLSQRRRGAAEFVEWAEKEHVPLENDEPTVLAAFEKTLEVHRKSNGKLNKQGEAAMEMAKTLLERGRRYLQPPEAAPEPDTAEPLTTKEETEMPIQKNEMLEEQMEQEQEQEEYVDEDTELLADESEEEEQPKRSRRPPPVQVQYVQAPPRGRRGPPVEKAAPRSSALKGILPRPEKVRLYKRNEMGKREMIDDFTVDEIGDMKLEQFIREYIDPQFSNEGIDTEYIAYELDPRSGKEKQPPASITIRGSGEQQQASDPFNTVRKAMGMLQEMQGMAQQPQAQPKNPMLEMAQQRAAQTGDVSSMMMLMMMERFMGGQQTQKPNEELLFKILDRLEKVERGETRRPMGMGPPMGPEFGPPGFNGFPPPPFYPPPPPPPRHVEREDRGTDKLLDLAMAKLAQPPPTLADSVKELMALQTLMQPRNGDSSEVAALRQELRQMSERMAPRSADSLEASLATFEKLTTIAKSVTQQTGGGDTGGFLKNLITPEVGKVIAGVVANTMAAQQAQPPGPMVQQTVQGPLAAPQPVAPPAPPPRDPNQPPQPPPKAVVDAVKAFQFAQTPEVQAQRFVDVIFAMYTSQDPFYVKLLQPALEDLNKADQSVEFLKGPRRLGMLLIGEMVPRLATPDFVDAGIAALALKAGVEQLPETLTSTKGRWALKNNEVVMLDDVAKPVEEKKEEQKAEAVSNGANGVTTASAEVIQFEKKEQLAVPASA